MTIEKVIVRDNDDIIEITYDDILKQNFAKEINIFSCGIKVNIKYKTSMFTDNRNIVTKVPKMVIKKVDATIKK